jgi:hypothetical protein
MNWLASVRKAFAGALGAALVWAQEVPNFQHLTRGDVIGLVEILGTGLVGYNVPNAVRAAKQVLNRPPLTPATAPLVQAQVSGVVPEPAPTSAAPEPAPAAVPAA